jgi:hypothetical protein
MLLSIFLFRENWLRESRSFVMGVKGITLLHVHGTLWYFGSKERLDEAFVPSHIVHHLQSYCTRCVFVYLLHGNSSV